MSLSLLFPAKWAMHVMTGCSAFPCVGRMAHEIAIHKANCKSHLSSSARRKEQRTKKKF
jgi:hypothetical protein